MSLPVNINGVIIPYPQTGDTGWGDDATKFAVEVASVLGKIGQSQAPVNDDIIVSPGNLSVTSGNLSVGGDASVTGNTTLTGVLNVDSGVLYVDPTNNRVGINDATPSVELDVNGAVAITGNTTVDGVIYADDNTTANTPVLSFTGDTNTGIGRSAADTLDFITNGNSRFRIEPTGQIKAVYESQVGTDYNTQLDNGYLCRAWVNFNGAQNNNLSGTYSQSGTTVTVTATNHGYIVGNQISIDITTGTAVDGTYLVTNVIDSNNFTYTAGTSLTTSGNCTLLRNTIRASGNISSISDNGTGDYTVNFTTALPDVNYAILSSSEQSIGNSPVNINRNNSRTDTAFRTNICTTQGSTYVDISWVSIGIFR